MRARTLALIALLQALPAAAAGLTPPGAGGEKDFFRHQPLHPPQPVVRHLSRAGGGLERSGQ